MYSAGTIFTNSNNPHNQKTPVFSKRSTVSIILKFCRSKERLIFYDFLHLSGNLSDHGRMLKEQNFIAVLKLVQQVKVKYEEYIGYCYGKNGRDNPKMYQKLMSLIIFF